MTAALQLVALADPTRRAVFEAVARGPCSVAEIASRLPVSRPAVSQHLKVLEQAALVRFDRVGNKSIYRVEGRGLVTLREYLDSLWAEALPSLKSLAEAAYRQQQHKDP